MGRYRNREQAEPPSQLEIDEARRRAQQQQAENADRERNTEIRAATANFAMRRSADADNFARSRIIQAREDQMQAVRDKNDAPAIAAANTALKRSGDYWAGMPAGAIGKLNGNPVEIAGNKLVVHFPSGGTASTKKGGDIHGYLAGHKDFEPTVDYQNTRNAATAQRLGAGEIVNAPTALGPPLTDPNVAPPATALALGASGGEPSAIRAKPAGERTPYEASYLTGYDGQPPVAPVPDPGLLYKAGQAVAGLVGRVGNAVVGSPQAPPAPSVAPVATGADVPAGVSRGQAARVQTPTQENPVPVTETSPAPNINKTDQATAPAANPVAYDQPLPDEWKNKRYQFAGF